MNLHHEMTFCVCMASLLIFWWEEVFFFLNFPTGNLKREGQLIGIAIVHIVQEFTERQ